MHWIEVEVTLSLRDARCNPDVKLWLDLEPDGALASEMALPLQRRGARWTGAFVASDRDGEEFCYRLGIAAHEGAQFWLRMRERRAGRVLLDDGDVLCSAKCMLVGSWAGSAARPAELAKPRPPHLVLVRPSADGLHERR